MIEVGYCPGWFAGGDILADVVSVTVVLLIAVFAFKFYNFGKDASHLHLGLGFTLIGLGFLARLLTNVAFSRGMSHAVMMGEPFHVGYLLYRALILIGLYLLYTVYHKQDKSNMVLAIFLLLMATYVSVGAYYLFHLTALMILLLLTVGYFRYCACTTCRTTKLLGYSFGVLAISQLLFMFIMHSKLIYALAQIAQLLAFVGLLVTFIMVLHRGKKKR